MSALGRPNKMINCASAVRGTSQESRDLNRLLVLSFNIFITGEFMSIMLVYHHLENAHQFKKST